MTSYSDFLARKKRIDPMTGLLTVPDLPNAMFAFQRDITAWALRRGRAALFAGTGLGKSFMELACETVLTPFLGIGSEVYGAVAAGRKGIGFELKPSYFVQAVKNIAELHRARTDDMFAGAA